MRAGSGGNGNVSFRREKFIDHGGPNGGDGGRGGNIVFEASTSESTLVAFRNQPKLVAEDGGAGGQSDKHGRDGADLIIKVPVGTQITSEEGVLADLTEVAQRAILARGGQGGFGNAHFKSSTRQAPKFAELGEPGEARKLTLELKMIADVGLVGLPNAGKSTLLSVLSNARPEIADYPFTTLTPNLGVVDVDGHDSLLFADIPGLIEGAADGKGLGHEFLRHVERTATLIHMIDAYQDDVVKTYQTIWQELKKYQVDLTTRPQIVVLNKTEGLSQEGKDKLVAALKKVTKGSAVLAISAQARVGLDELRRAALESVRAYRAQELAKKAEEPDAGLPVIKLKDDSLAWKVEKEGSGFRVSGRKIEKFAIKTDFNNSQSVARLRDIMRKMGITHELTRRGAEIGQTINILDRHITF